MLKCMILDDEPLALDLLEDYIRDVPYLQLVARCTNAMGALAILQQEQVDLVFSDIQMQGLSGIQLIKTLQTKPMFVMVTAYSNYAVEGYEIDIVDYLLKPVSYERFVKAANKAHERYQLTNKSNKQPDHIFLHVDYSLVRVVLDDIVYIEGVKDYVRIHYVAASKKQPLLVRISMKGIEEILPPATFCRIHKSYIVNAAMVTAIRKSSVHLDVLELPISEQYKDVVVRLTNRKI